MAVILDGLRDLARRAHTAILLVHHARKAAAGHSPGARLRGSSDLAAFGDSNLYLRRLADAGDLELRIEHRAAAGPEPRHLRLCVDAAGSSARFETRARNSADQDPSASRLLALLEASTAPLPTSELRNKLGLRNQTVAAAPQTLLAQGRIERRGRDGWALARTSLAITSAATELLSAVQLEAGRSPKHPPGSRGAAPGNAEPPWGRAQ